MAAGLQVDWSVILLLERTSFATTQELFNSVKSNAQTSASSGQFLSLLQSKSSTFSSVTALAVTVSNATVAIITNPPVPMPSSMPTSSSPKSKSRHKKVDRGLIIGITIGGFFFLVLAALAVFYYLSFQRAGQSTRVDVYRSSNTQQNQRTIPLNNSAQAAGAASNIQRNIDGRQFDDVAINDDMEDQVFGNVTTSAQARI
jgi:hypothetical protein